MSITVQRPGGKCLQGERKASREISEGRQVWCVLASSGMTASKAQRSLGKAGEDNRKQNKQIKPNVGGSRFAWALVCQRKDWCFSQS